MPPDAEEIIASMGKKVKSRSRRTRQVPGPSQSPGTCGPTRFSEGAPSQRGSLHSLYCQAGNGAGDTAYDLDFLGH